MADVRAAAEIRSFTMRGFLLGQFDQVADDEERAQLGLARRQTTVRIADDIAGGLGTMTVLPSSAVTDESLFVSSQS